MCLRSNDLFLCRNGGFATLEIELYLNNLDPVKKYKPTTYQVKPFFMGMHIVLDIDVLVDVGIDIETQV